MRSPLPDSPRVRFWLAASAVLLLAFSLRVHGLGRESLFMDEIAQVVTYGKSPGEILQLAAGHPQPPLDYWIGNLMGNPDSDARVRIPAVFFGTGSVLLLMLLCSRFLPGPAAAIPGLLLALSPYSLYFSQQARPYSISIFFLLATLLALDRALRREKAGWPAWLLLFLCATAFLWSRVFTPMVTLVSLAAVLALAAVLSPGPGGPPEPAAAGGRWWNQRRKRLFLSIAVFAGALLAFLPLFRLLLAKGSARGWASTGGMDPFALVAKGLSSFTLVPLWKSYMAQLDPLGLILLPFVLAAVVLALAAPGWRKDPLLFLVPLALPVAGFVEILLFGATSTFDIWRPPFPIWMLPFALLSAFASLAFLGGSPWLKGRAPRWALAAFLVLCAGVSARAAVAEKSRLVNDDWRGLCSWLTRIERPDQVLFFGSVVPQYGWEPTFWGFPRYYKGGLQMAPLMDAPNYAARLAGARAEPVVIVYRFRNAFLTPTSPYPIFIAPKGEQEIGNGSLAADPELEVKLFNSFAVVRLREPQGDLGRDTYAILERVLADFPQQPAHLARLHYAAAFVGHALGEPSWARHRDLALAGLKADPLFRRSLELLGEP